MRVGRGEKLEFEARLSPIERQGLGLVLARYYREFGGAAGGGVNPLEFVRNVQSAWGVTNMSGTVLEGMRRMVRFLRRRWNPRPSARNGSRF